MGARSDEFAGLERFDDVDATGEAAMFARFLEHEFRRVRPEPGSLSG